MISVETALELHARVVEKPECLTNLHALQDRSRACADAPHRSAAVWLYGLLRGLLFKEGNRPTAVFAMEADYEVSGYRVDTETQEFKLLIIDIVGGKIGEEDVAVRLLSLAKRAPQR